MDDALKLEIIEFDYVLFRGSKMTLKLAVLMSLLSPEYTAVICNSFSFKIVQDDYTHRNVLGAETNFLTSLSPAYKTKRLCIIPQSLWVVDEVKESVTRDFDKVWIIDGVTKPDVSVFDLKNCISLTMNPTVEEFLLQYKNSCIVEIHDGIITGLLKS